MDDRSGGQDSSGARSTGIYGPLGSVSLSGLESAACLGYAAERSVERSIACNETSPPFGPADEGMKLAVA